MFVHHVLFWLKNPTSEADQKALIAGLEELSKLDLIRQAHIGVPAANDRPVIDRTYAISWLNIFDSAEDEKIYQTHPMHLKFIADCKHLWERVIIYDSENA